MKNTFMMMVGAAAGIGMYVGMEKVKQNQLNNYIKFIDKQPAEKIPEYYANADMAFITLKKDLISDQILPAKLPSYFACGIPILGSANGEIKNVIEKSEAGYCVESGNAEELEKQIEICMKLSKEEFQKMKEKSRQFYNENFEQQLLLNKFEGKILK